MLTVLFVSVYACAASECVCVLASTVDDWLLCRVGGFALYSLEHRGGWPLLPTTTKSMQKSHAYELLGNPIHAGIPSKQYPGNGTTGRRPIPSML